MYIYNPDIKSHASPNHLIQNPDRYKTKGINNKNISKMKSATQLLIFIIGCSTASAYSGDATWYDVSVGYTACGTLHSNSEYVAATSFRFWTTPNPNLDPMCQKRARVTDPTTGRQVIVNIKDKCGGCAEGDIDMTPSAFEQLRPLSVGRFRVNWEFI